MNSLTQGKPRGFIESALALLLLLILLFNLYTVLSVFLGVFTYAIIFSVSFAKLFERLARLFKNKRKLAAFIYALLLIAIIALPFIYIISVLSDYAAQAEQWMAGVKANGIPALPDWIAGLPFAGKKIAGEQHWKTILDMIGKLFLLVERREKPFMHNMKKIDIF